jgi:hypothetical protein
MNRISRFYSELYILYAVLKMATVSPVAVTQLRNSHSGGLLGHCRRTFAHSAARHSLSPIVVAQNSQFGGLSRISHRSHR